MDRDGPHSGWQGAPSLAGPGGGKQVEARCGAPLPPTQRGPSPICPCAPWFPVCCHQVGARHWPAAGKALAAPETKPRCKTQPGVSARWAGGLGANPELGLEIKLLWSETRGCSEGGLGGLTAAAAAARQLAQPVSISSAELQEGEVSVLSVQRRE